MHLKYVLVAALSLACSDCAKDSVKQESPILKNSEQEALRKLDETAAKDFRAYDDFKEFVKAVKHRNTGTPEGAKAEEYAFQKLASFGYTPKFYEFKIRTWRRKSASLQITGKNFKFSPETVSLGFTPLKSDVKQAIYDMGDGNEPEYLAKGKDLKGKIALVNLYPMGNDWTKNLHRSEKSELAYKAGAKGIIFINRYEKEVLLTGTASHSDELIKIPAICISIESGRKIREHLSDNTLSARILVQNSAELIRGRNVIATLEGTDLKNERIVLGAHLDSWDLSEAAIDNGIGAFSVLEIAKNFKRSGVAPRRTIEFVLWMGEEFGLLGSTDYIKKEVQNKTVDSIKFYVNIDMAGNPQGYDLEGREEMLPWFRGMAAFTAANHVSFKGKITSVPNLYSDNVPFALQGIPALQMLSGLDAETRKYYHSNQDHFGLVNKEHLENTVRIMAIPVYLLSVKDTIESDRLTSEQTRDFYKKYNMETRLRLGKQWRWQ